MNKQAMQNFKIIFLLLGSVIGAGFISGSEIIRFFLKTNIIVSIPITFAIFFLTTYLILKKGRNSESGMFFKKNSVSYYFMLLCSFLILASMLSGIDSLFFLMFNISKKSPIFSILTLVVGIYFITKGIDGISKLSLIIIPFIIVFVFFVLIANLNVNISDLNLSKLSIKTIYLPFLYVGMNIFLATPLVFEAGKTYRKANIKKCSLIFASIICVLILLVILSLKGKAEHLEMPLFQVFQANKIVSILYFVSVFFGILTTFLSSYFPLYQFAKSKNREFLGIIIISILSFLLSRLGLSVMVGVFYPIIGLIGIVVILKPQKQVFTIRKFQPISKKIPHGVL